MAATRKIFPTEEVMELIAGKGDANANAVASHILGQPVNCAECAKAAAPFAAAWLAKLYPRFMDMEWNEGDNWNVFVKHAKQILGDNVSIPPMSGRLKDLVAQTLNALKDAKESLLRQTDAAAKLEQQVRELEPLQAIVRNLQKKNDELEAKLKAMKTEMGGLQRKVNEFQGKMPIDNDELMQTIQDAIKSGLKGLAVGAAAGGAAAAADETEAAPAQNEVPDDFGFGTSGADSDGFGF